MEVLNGLFKYRITEVLFPLISTALGLSVEVPYLVVQDDLRDTVDEVLKGHQGQSTAVGPAKRLNKVHQLLPTHTHTHTRH